MLKPFYPFTFCLILFFVAGRFIYPQNIYFHNTGNIKVSVFDNGWIGHDNSGKGAPGSGVIFEENPDRTIKNIVSSSFKGYDAPFKRQVFISRVAIYDDNKNLIGIATLSNPILKEEDQDLTFKIKLDI